jgi:replicative DNA helicase
MTNIEPSKLDLDYYENVILLNSLLNQEYLACVIEHLDPSYFNDKNIGTVFSSIISFFLERGVPPTLTEIKSKLTTENEKKAFADVGAKLKQLDTNFNKDELIANTERFLKERSLVKAINEAAEKYTSGKIDLQETLSQFEKVYNISLVEDLGYFYFEDIERHIKELTTVYNPLPTGWKFLDERLEGGLFPKTLTCLVGQVNVGKSIFLGNIAANMVLANRNVLLISLEMSEFMYAKRISAQVTQIPHNQLSVYTDELKQQVEHVERQLESKLVIKEYPPKTVTVRHIDSYITKLGHRGFKPEVVVIDYINLLKPSSKNLNSYESVKEVAEQLRALSFKYNIPFVTASQLNRGAFNTASPGMEGISECIEVNQMITLRDGTKKKIGDVKFGDQITSHDGYKTVTQVHHRDIKSCYKLKLKSGKEIIVSSKHKFPTPDGRLSVEDGLKIGAKLNTRDS